MPLNINNQKLVITIPMSNTPSDAFTKSLPKSIPIIVIDDSNGNLTLDRKRFNTYDYKRQNKVLGEFYEDFRIFHHSSACRNLAHYLAYKFGFEVIIALDYDCKVPETFLSDHLNALRSKNILGVSTNTGWINPLLNNRWYSRGYPYESRTPDLKFRFQKVKSPRVVLNSGLWENVLDINAIDKILSPPPKKISLKKNHLVVLGNIPISGMNNSFLREIIPAYFFLPNFRVGNWIVSRHDDIWGGYILEKLTNKKGDFITFGKPIVIHLRESYQPQVLSYEHYIHLLSHHFYNLVDRAVEEIKKSDYKTMYAEFTEQFRKVLFKEKKHLPKTYFEGFKYLNKSMLWWVNLFKKL